MPATTISDESPPQSPYHTTRDIDSDVEADAVETTGVEHDSISESESDAVETTGVEHDRRSDSDESNGDEPTESELYADAEARGRAAAAGHPLPKRGKRTRRDPVYEYIHAMFGDMAPHVLFTLLDDVSVEEHMSLLTAQMSAKAGLKQFGQAVPMPSSRNWSNSSTAR